MILTQVWEFKENPGWRKEVAEDFKLADIMEQDGTDRSVFKLKIKAGRHLKMSLGNNEHGTRGKEEMLSSGG